MLISDCTSKKFWALTILVSLVILILGGPLSSTMHHQPQSSSLVRRNRGPFETFSALALDTNKHVFASPPLNDNQTHPKASPSTPIDGSASFSSAVVGPQTTIVICVEFSNLNHTQSISDINKLVFEDMNRYYQEVSYGAISIVGRTVGWYSLNYTLSYYGRDGLTVDDSNYDGSIDSWWLIRDAVKAANRDVDFAQYDHVIVVHAGNGEESSKVSDDIWSVEYSGLWIKTQNARSVNDGMIVPETEARGAVPFGVCCHEYGHELGLPDLYEYGSPSKSDVGDWSLMDHGCWGGDPPGSSPSDPMAYCKIQLGWIRPSRIMVVNASMNVNVTLQPIELKTDGYQAIKIPIKGRQYYLVEDRQKIGVDLGLPSSGVLISYVNEQLGSGYGRVKLIDSHPLTATFDDAAFDVGQVFADSKNKLSVSVLSSDGKAYLIDVDRSGPAPDIAITDIRIEPSAAHTNETVKIYANVTNQGTDQAMNFYVNCYIDGSLYTRTRLTLSAGRSTTISVEWKATGGLHNIRFAVDQSSLSVELKRNNDEMSKNIAVGLVLKLHLPKNFQATINGTLYSPDQNNDITAGVLPGALTLQVPKVQLTGNDTRQVFVRWSDNNTSNLRNVIIESDLSLSVEYKTQYYVAVNPNGGSVSGEGWYDEASTVKIIANTPCNEVQQKSRELFTQWSGDSMSNMTTLTITVDQPYTLAANWKRQYYLSVNSNYGQTLGSGWYDANALATYSIQPANEIGNDTRRYFTGWTGDGASNQISSTITMDSPKSLSATWRTQYRLNVLSPFGDPTGTDWYDSGTVVNITVKNMVDLENGTRRVFMEWRGDIFASSPTTAITMDRAKTVVAEWKTQYKLLFTASGLPDGVAMNFTINSNVATGNTPFTYSDWYDSQTSLNLNATAKIKQGFRVYVFDHWIDSNGARVTNVIIVDYPDTITAVYTQSFGCVIATATFGSELSPEVQFLRNLRDQKILRTFAGSQFMTVFNAWYYSFSPAVAATIAKNEFLRSLSKIILYPLIGMLHVSAFTYNALECRPELAVVAAGFVASYMIGTVYFAPIIAAFFTITHKKTKSIRGVKVVLSILASAVIGIVVSEALGLDLVMMLSSTLFVLVTISLSVVVLLRLISLVSSRLK